MDPKEMEWEVVDWIHLVRERSQHLELCAGFRTFTSKKNSGKLLIEGPVSSPWDSDSCSYIILCTDTKQIATVATSQVMWSQRAGTFQNLITVVSLVITLLFSVEKQKRLTAYQSERSRGIMILGK